LTDARLTVALDAQRSNPGATTIGIRRMSI
jgi:hypothetical protein